jgi:hypothetical protein
VHINCPDKYRFTDQIFIGANFIFMSHKMNLNLDEEIKDLSIIN